MARVGVFVCWCGSNIAKSVDVEAVAEAASKMPNVAYATHYKYMCSEPGQNLIKEAIKEHHLDRIVVASCSPRLHQETFRRCIAEAGLNPFLCEMANIREQCSWVHDKTPETTQKAIDLIRMTVARTARNEELSQSQIPINRRALVVGGGIAGIQAALDIAASGYEVTLVEKTPSIGGHMAQYDKTFPTLDCAACILTPKMVDVASNNKIKLMTYSEVESVSGFVGNFDVKIRKKARSVDMKKCTGCGVCYGKCPTKGIPSEFDENLGTRSAIYVPFPQAVPNAPVIDREHCRYFTSGKCGVCQKLCPSGAIDYEQQDEIVTENFGAIVVATGFHLMDHSVYGEFGHGKYPDVITGVQFERLFNASGPTQGQVVRPSDHKTPKKVVFIQCVGSRDENKGHPYCSKVCCMYTAKQALLVREKVPDSEVTIFYMDVRANGKGYDEFVRRAVEEYGANYVRGKVSKIYQLGDKLVLKGSDTLLGAQLELEADLVVLATAMESQPDAKEVARMLNISADANGFFSEAHPKLRPVECLTAGVYLAGACQYPKDIPDTVAQASGAASKVVGLFANDHLLSEACIAEVDDKMCAGCLACKEVCPFKAIDAVTLVDRRTKKSRVVAKVNEGMCHGCGTCTATCRSAAIRLRGFTDEQILSQIDAFAWK